MLTRQLSLLDTLKLLEINNDVLIVTFKTYLFYYI